ncbi:MAG: aminotransferase class IV [Chloroflexota bacterium]
MADVPLYSVTETGAKELDPPEPLASLYDLPDALSLGVYTAMRTYDHYKFLRLSDHLRRLEESMAVLNWRYELDERAIRRALHQVCMAYEHPDARVRIDVLAQTPGPRYGNSRVLVALAPFEPPPAAVYERGVRLALAPALQRRHPQAKTADFALARRAYPINSDDSYDFLLLDEEEHLLEGSTSNFYAVRDGSVWTAGAGMLEGITRKVILELIQEAGIQLQLQAPRLEDVPLLDEAFLSSSSRGLAPVREIDGKVVGDGRPGPITKQLMLAYDEFVARSVRPAVALD